MKVVKPEAEQHAVEPCRERHRHPPPPRLRDLAADLRQDPRPARLADRGGQRQRGGHGQRGGPARAERLPEQRQAAERDRATGQGAGRERRARRERGPQPPRVAVRGERLHHREATGRPRAGHAGRRRGEHEHGLQHGVS
jgi:hypothetical protein